MDGIVGPAGTRTIAQVRNKLRKSALQLSYFENRVNCATQANEHNCRKARHPSASGATFYPAHAQGAADYFPAGVVEPGIALWQFRQLVHNLFGFLARHEAVRAGHGARIGLVGIEYTVLISIRHLSAEEGDVSVNRVADHLHLSGAFVTTITNKLLKRGLIHKTPDPADRRRVRLEVSSKGSALLAKLAPVQRRINDVQFGCLSAKEFRQLLDITERLIDCSERAVKLQAYIAGQPDWSRRPRLFSMRPKAVRRCLPTSRDPDAACKRSS